MNFFFFLVEENSTFCLTDFPCIIWSATSLLVLICQTHAIICLDFPELSMYSDPGSFQSLPIWNHASPGSPLNTLALFPINSLGRAHCLPPPTFPLFRGVPSGPHQGQEVPDDRAQALGLLLIEAYRFFIAQAHLSWGIWAKAKFPARAELTPPA